MPNQPQCEIETSPVAPPLPASTVPLVQHYGATSVGLKLHFLQVLRYSNKNVSVIDGIYKKTKATVVWTHRESKKTQDHNITEATLVNLHATQSNKKKNLKIKRTMTKPQVNYFTHTHTDRAGFPNRP